MVPAAVPVAIAASAAHLVALGQCSARLLYRRFRIRPKTKHNTTGMAGQMVLLASRPRHFLVAYIQRCGQVAKVRLERLLPDFCDRSIYLRQLVDQLLHLVL